MVEVVVGALIMDGRVLLGHRRPDKHVNPDVWDLPGGVIEAGETELGALVRELHEELGVQVAEESVTNLCRVLAGRSEDPVRLSAWLVREWQGIPTNRAPEEHVGIGWFAVDDVPPLGHDLVRSSLVSALRSQPG